MQTYRLITIVMMLLAQDTISAQTFAELFHVTKRTIMRDMDHLSSAHIPVVATRGVNGGFRLLDTYKFDKRLLTVEDLQNILTAVQGLDALLVDPDVAATLTKVSGLLPSDQTGSLAIDFNGAKNLAQVVQTLQQAIRDHHLVAFGYYDRNGVATSRLVEPYQLLWRNTSWYLVGYATERQAYRTFRLSRMTTLKPEASFTPRTNVPLGWQGGGGNGERVAVHVTGLQACRSFVVEHFGQQVITANREADFDAVLPVGDNADTYRFLAQCGINLKVIGPTSFREGYRDYLKQMWAQQD
ncbi:helix-turn-helix transcriptional regulator [Lacticaseibacillus porcinae]|uniref:helix-turn-helix transcriptional regulator n=1 Tax=Lacticaseibacillus porcinae TaxID=1123687 RepID=UPI000F797108|nr:YafY family protein [Lacticaseibacillus porcinae]